MKKIILTITAIIMFVLNYAQVGTHIPESRLPQIEPAWWDSTQSVLPWQNAGCLDYLRANGGMVIDKFIDVSQDLSGNVSLSQEINEILSDNELYDQSLLFYFPPGEYEIDETITINRDNVVFRGAGADKTTLLFTKEWGEDLDEQLLRYNLFEVEGSTYIGFENMKLETIDSTTINSSNNPADYDGMYVKFTNSNYCWVAGLETFKAQRHHIVINKSSHIEIRGCYFSKAHEYGNNGNGYGVQLLDSLTTYCLIEDNIFRKNRHAIVFNDEAHYNVAGYNYQREAKEYETPLLEINYCLAQICFHGHNDSYEGGGPYQNLAEGNIVDFIVVDISNGSNGDENLIFRNRTNDLGIQIESGNNNQLLVNNYVNCGRYEVCNGDLFAPDLPWDIHGQGHLKKNNKVKDKNWLDQWDVNWHDHSSEFWEDKSYYHDSIPVFFQDQSWPFDPRDDDNQAKERWNNEKRVVDILGSHFLLKNEYYSYSKFYTFVDPINSDNQNELFLCYCGVNNEDTVYVTIEQNNSIINGWDHKEIYSFTQYDENILPYSYFIRRIAIENSTNPISVTISIPYDDVDQVYSV